MFPAKFIYAHPPSWVLTVQWEQQAFARVAAYAFQLAQKQDVVLASAWRPPTEAHHTWHRTSYWALPRRWNYNDWCDPVVRGITT